MNYTKNDGTVVDLPSNGHYRPTGYFTAYEIHMITGMNKFEFDDFINRNYIEIMSNITFSGEYIEDVMQPCEILYPADICKDLLKREGLWP